MGFILVLDNDVKKPPMFVFKDMEDFKNRGKDVDAEYMKVLTAKKKGESKTTYVPPVIPKPQPKPPVVIPADIVGKKVGHKSFGTGVITGIDGGPLLSNLTRLARRKWDTMFV